MCRRAPAAGGGAGGRGVRAAGRGRAAGARAQPLWVHARRGRRPAAQRGGAQPPMSARFLTVQSSVCPVRFAGALGLLCAWQGMGMGIVRCPCDAYATRPSLSSPFLNCAGSLSCKPSHRFPSTTCGGKCNKVHTDAVTQPAFVKATLQPTAMSFACVLAITTAHGLAGGGSGGGRKRDEQRGGRPQYSRAAGRHVLCSGVCRRDVRVTPHLCGIIKLT